MCLSYELKPKQADKIKAEARRRGYIRVWKVCEKRCTGWYKRTRWKKGLRKALHLRRDDGGWYAYLNHEEAKRTLYFESTYLYLKVCYTKASWIKRLGFDARGRKVGIFTHLCFPDWERGDMTIREFRAMCKGKK